MTLTEQLVKYIWEKPVREEDLHAASFLVLDAVACIIGGVPTEPGEKLTTWANYSSKDAARNAFLLGGLAHILEIDDLHRASVTHPGCIAVPAAWAVAEQQGAKGRDFLKAVLYGYEACCRVGMTVDKDHYKIWHNTSTCGPFGSAAAAASLLSLSQQQTVWALGNAGTQSSGLWQFLEDGVMSKHLHTARAAESGVIAAQLAALDFSGPPQILEGKQGFLKATCREPNLDALLADAPGWQVSETSIKPWPSCRHTHPAIDATLELAPQINIDAIKSISIETYQAAINVCDNPLPTSAYAAKFSLQHCVAAALLEKQIGFHSFTHSAREDAASLSSKITISHISQYEDQYPLNWGAKIIVKLHNGDIFESERMAAKGDPENPMAESEIINKAEQVLSQGRLSSEQNQELIRSVLALLEDHALPNISLH